MDKAAVSGTGRNAVLSRRQIESLIAEGRTIIIVDQKVLKCDAWLPYHPGGDIAIRHMIGRDATDEVNALHSPEARRQMNAYQIGRIEGRWENFVPPIQGGKFRKYVEGAEEEPEPEQECDNEQTSSSRDSSIPSSPLFEPADQNNTRLRHRQSSKTSHRDPSVSSWSSLEEESPKPGPKMSHLDMRTQEQIELDLSKYPPLDPAVQDEIIHKYRLLNERIKKEGLYQCRYSSYFIELSRYSLLFGLCLLFLRWGWYATSAMFLGMFWHQLVFSAHDAGHMGITHDFQIDSVLGIIIADFLGGLSIGWWKRNHNVHHIVTNSPEHDPDIEHLPFFAISHRFFNSLRSTFYERTMTYDAFAKFFIRYQDFLYYPILTFGRFNLYALSWEYLLRGLGPRKGIARWHRWLEIAGQVFFWTWFGYGMLYKSIPDGWNRFVFLMISHMVTMPVHVQITLSHFAMSTADLGERESFPQKMLRTTMDVDCPEWLDFFHGGLQFQAIHHLFPRIPRHNLRQTQKLVVEFCEEVGIPYALYGFTDGNKQVIGRLGEVGRQAAILAECQRSLAAFGAEH
ncbi:putative fatty acid desaturase [Xylona heveae TC161]|uniref:Delta 8-(E)-sphingolipid desaturase n=1 Tax=Xylona heveae (strain CBS 132557 / TC161) TaxID=1328760 RepID=A0A165G881_XYLHT|nr:putative fatty acid desaturase [Xylona heveae TC161]KZF21855.1 putative fatty acid desaturase [Xylona heveae TC161]